MNLLKTLLDGQNGDLVKQLAGNFNLDEGQAGAAVSQLLPALTTGMKKNMAAPGGLDGLLGALKSGNHQQYVDNPAAALRPEAVADGNGILGHLLGSKDVSREVAARAASNTGIDVGTIKQMLPMVAAMTMGAASKETQQAGISSASGSDTMGMLSKMLDSDGDGSVADDLLGLAKKFF